jgi:putative holliday junction resolvase
MGRILALDYGEKRIGVAVSDEGKKIAFPKPYILNSEKKKLLEYIPTQDIEEILLGIPVGLSGQETESTKKVREFAEWLERETSLKINLIDERLTTKEIMKSEKNRERIDSLVAQKMLERYLEKII